MPTTQLSTILSIVSPAFILIVLGYLTVKFAWLDKRGVRALGWFTTRVALPAAIFQALSSRNLADIFHADYLIVYGVGSLIAYFTVFIVAKSMFKKPLTESAFYGLGSSMSNTILIGYPIIIQIFGPAAVIPFALTLIIENLVILPLSLALAESGMRKEGHFLKALVGSLGTLAKNPIILSIAMGLLFSLLSISLPSAADSAIQSLAATASGLAQYTIGGILAGVALTVLSKDMSLVILGKLIIHSAAILLMIFMLPPMDPMFTSIAVILSCLPMFSVYAVLAMDYELGEFCSAVLLPTTVLSFITISLAIWFQAA